MNTLRKCHSTVRALMYSCAPISGLVRPSKARRGYLLLLGCEVIARFISSLADCLSRRL